MCGIAGAFGADAHLSVDVVEALNRAQHARGPDHQMVVAEGPFVLGNTRLAIQDLTTTANQPFRDPGGRFTVVFNGEIYNFKELARRYGLAMRTRCDGEVIPLLWARLGPRCLHHFRGMYGIAVADHRERRLYLARDPFGIKPLHWRQHRASVLFASDVSALWQVDRALPLDRGALGDFLRFGAVGAARSPYERIETVAPGACVSIGYDGLAHHELTVPAADQPAPHHGLSAPDDHGLAEAFRSSVRLHLLADVPTALLLSAGVDSALLALAARDDGRSLHCLTVAACGAADESPQASATAAQYGHTHQTVNAEVDEATVDAFLSVMPRPTIDGLNTFLISRAVKAAGYKVALSGLGADEALGGYGYARAARALPLLRLADLAPGGPGARLSGVVGRRADSSGSGKRGRLLGPGGPRSLGGLVELQRELFSEAGARALLGLAAGGDNEWTGRDEEPRGRGRGASALARAEMARYLQPMLLADADAFSMAASVELRVPFVDGPFFVAALRRRQLGGKRQLVRQMGDRYLELLSRRPKTGFSLPMQEWIRSGALRQVVADAARDDAPVWQHLDPSVGQPVLTASPARARWSEAWALAALDGWLRRR